MQESSETDAGYEQPTNYNKRGNAKREKSMTVIRVMLDIQNTS